MSKSTNIPTNGLSNKDLLIRIDERQQQIRREIELLRGEVCKRVENDDDYHDLRKKVNTLWDWKNKTIGYAAGAGAVASLTFELLKSVL